MYRRGIAYQQMPCSVNVTSHWNWYRTHRGPDVKHDIGGFWQAFSAGDLRVLLLVPSTDLIKGCADDKEPKNRVEIVLRRAASESGFGLEHVDKVADDDLDDVKDEKSESKSLKSRFRYDWERCSGSS